MVLPIAHATDELDRRSHRVELRYSLSRYIVWLLPTVGFIGTVVGIAGTLGILQGAEPDLHELAATLSVAFDTTIVALIQSGIVVLLLHAAEAREERSVNLAGGYTLRNLVNRLYAPGA